MLSFDQIWELYAVDIMNGCANRPGKFEGCHWSTIALWEVVMDGGSDETIYLDDEPYDCFVLSDEDRATYNLSADVYAIVLHEDSQGFVYGAQMTAENYESFLNSADTGE